jgi:hypothetical protein
MLNLFISVVRLSLRVLFKSTLKAESPVNAECGSTLRTPSSFGLESQKTFHPLFFYHDKIIEETGAIPGSVSFVEVL